ncbi:Replication-associated protein RepC [Apilactobacillus xinyiensis]|uniref:Replication-associated protein RepC n=1 Tax=Apilactobacillus xinyiensis TaxID=2841032 RepID=UPI001C7D3008|nr:Replication-associated protein RepC [Apilactobacillus xinyiensis]
MAMKLNKDRNRKLSGIKETKISTPEHTYSEADNNKVKTKKTNKLGRPRKNKQYSSLRIQKQSVGKINAFQNTLGYVSQDDFIADILEKAEKDLTAEQRTMFNMYLRAYEIRTKTK